MSDGVHIKPFRLFDKAHSQRAGKEFQLSEWETTHLADCAECRCVFIVIARQLKHTLALFSNGEISTEDGWYKNLCCGLESYVIAGTAFPDCVRHKNLPTAWNFVSADSARRTTTTNKQKDPAA
jgi:hypothetical protein